MSCVSGVRSLQVPKLLAATDQAGEAEEDGAATTTTTTRHHLMTTRDDQAKAHMAQISHRVGDLECGLAH